jgi:hypothetical protein
MKMSRPCFQHLSHPWIGVNLGESIRVGQLEVADSACPSSFSKGLARWTVLFAVKRRIVKLRGLFEKKSDPL